MEKQIERLQKILVERETIPFFTFWSTTSILAVLVSSSYPILVLNENQILYLFSSASQVIAAIFGLIITGYIFLRNELDRKASKDESLEEIIALLKAEYFGSIINISITTLSSILLCFWSIANESQNNFFLTILINISVTTVLTVLLLVIFFVIKILNPNSLEIASDRLKEFTAKDSSDERGSLEDFLKYYNQIEYILEKYGSAFSSDESDTRYSNRMRIPKTKLVHILFNAEKISSSLRDNLIKLISFRNSLIHGRNLFVSTQDVLFSEDIMNELKLALGVL